MSKFKNYLLFVVVLAVAAAIIGSQAKAWSTSKPETLPVIINISDISKNPLDFKGVKVAFECRFAAQGNMFKEKDNLFTPDKFENFSVWNNKIQFWKESELKKVYPTLYISKDRVDMIQKLRVLERFNKIEVIGVVESLYANMPWVRVTEIRVKSSDELDQPMASQISRAIKFIDNGEFQKAKICFEIATERKTPDYVTELITNQLVEIENIKTNKLLATKREEAKQILAIARNKAKNREYEAAATTYGKALKASKEYNNSAAIHKEIAGFFIDFYMSQKEANLLDYSINEFKIAQNIIGKPDDDILYALAYIESLKAKISNNYKRAELLARKCLQVNTHHYGGRKLLADILSCQLTKNANSNENTIILPVAPKKRIRLRKAEPRQEDVTVKIDDLISETELLAMEKEINEIDATLNSDLRQLNSTKNDIVKRDSPTNAHDIPGLSADEFKDILGGIEDDLNEINIDENTLSSTQETTLPDFPISESTSKLPKLAL